MKLFTVMLLSSLFVGANFEAVADEIDPEIEVFENYDYVKTFYKKLVKDNNIDTSFKFKQEALNGVLLGLTNGDKKSYFVATKDKIFSEHYKYYLDKKRIAPLYKDCTIVKDDVVDTLIRCPVYDEYSFFEFKNSSTDGKGIIKLHSFDSKQEHITPEEIKSYSTGTYASYIID